MLKPRPGSVSPEGGEREGLASRVKARSRPFELFNRQANAVEGDAVAELNPLGELAEVDPELDSVLKRLAGQCRSGGFGRFR